MKAILWPPGLRGLTWIGALCLGVTVAAAADEDASIDGSNRIVNAEIPFSLHFEELTFPDARALPRLQSFASSVTKDGKWILLGGRRQGLHTFKTTPPNFPPKLANNYIWLIDPETGLDGQFDVNELPASLAEPLQATSQQSYHDIVHDELYVVGGYGRSGSEMVTFDTIIRLPPTEVAKVIVSSASPEAKASRIRELIEIAHDSRLAVTGGELWRLHNDFFLVFGQKFMGDYTAFGNWRGYQSYTEEIRVFTLKPGMLTILSYGAAEDDSPDRPFHRRDGNVVMSVDPARGKPRIAAFGGVFRPGMVKGYTQPVYIRSPGLVRVDRSFDQKFSQYACPVIALYSKEMKTVFHTFVGGISHHYYSQSKAQKKVYWMVTEEGRNDGLPFIADITVLLQNSDGMYEEYILPDPIPDRRLLGTGAGLLYASSRDVYVDGTGSCVIDLDKIKDGETVVLGHIYGGIEAEFPLPLVSDAGTHAAAALFRVSLTRTPSGVIPAEGSAIEAKADPQFIRR